MIDENEMRCANQRTSAGRETSGFFNLVLAGRYAIRWTNHIDSIAYLRKTARVLVRVAAPIFVLAFGVAHAVAIDLVAVIAYPSVQ
jgi:hypothetical protein